MILIRYYDGCACESRTIDCEDIADAKSKLMALVSGDSASEIEIYECNKLFWNVDIFALKEKDK